MKITLKNYLMKVEQYARSKHEMPKLLAIHLFQEDQAIVWTHFPHKVYQDQEDLSSL